MKIVFVTNIPSPYRVIFFNELNKLLNDNLLVLYCARTEPNRKWLVSNMNHNHKFLKRSLLVSISPYKYFNPDIIKQLHTFKPDIIVTGGFYPTMLAAILYARIKNIRHFINSDSWRLTEKDFNGFHRLIRKIIYKSTDRFLPVSKKGNENFINYGVDPNKISIIPYVIDNTKYNYSPPFEKKYDLLFSGQIIERKMPAFFFDVCKKVFSCLKDLHVAIMGDGVLKDEILHNFENSGIRYSYLNFLQSVDLTKAYCESKILLFPTLSDGWGVVANEACAAGVPTITCENAGAAGDIIINDYNGYVLPLDSNIWCEHIIKILRVPELYSRLSLNALLQSIKYSPKEIAFKLAKTINQYEQKKNTFTD